MGWRGARNGSGTNCGKRDRGWFNTAKPGDEQISLKEHVECLTGDWHWEHHVELSGIDRSEWCIPRDMFESRISTRTKEKLPTRASRKPDAETISSWSYDMEGHAKKCVERYRELANKTTQQFFKVATPCMDDHQLKRRTKWVSRRIVYSLHTNCSAMSVFGSYWETWYFVVCEQACACSNKMDIILWQKLGEFHLLHSSYKWTSALL